jgi:hypothetical protein
MVSRDAPGMTGGLGGGKGAEGLPTDRSRLTLTVSAGTFGKCRSYVGWHRWVGDHSGLYLICPPVIANGCALGLVLLSVNNMLPIVRKHSWSVLSVASLHAL